MLEAVDALVEPTIAVIERAEDAPTGEARVRQAVEALLTLIAEQPAAAKMCFIEVYAVGPEGEAVVEQALDIFERFGVSQLSQIRGRKGMPPQMVRAMVGGLQKVIHKRLYSEEPEQLPKLAEEIADWALSYPPPPGPLEGPRRRGRKAKSFAERQAVAHPPERVLRALAAGRCPRRASSADDRRRGGRAGRDLECGSSTGTSRTRKTPSCRPWTAARRRCWVKPSSPAFRRARKGLAGVGAGG